MFRKSSPDSNPMAVIYDEINKPDTSDAEKYPTHLTHGSNSLLDWENKGRFHNITSHHDANFPEYNANLIGNHVLLEGPAQHNAGHCERFLKVLLNDNINITDVIAAGDPLDGREQGKRGYWHYFSDAKSEDVVDAKIIKALGARFEITSIKTATVEGISSYQVSIRYEGRTRHINVHHIENFGDFKTKGFTVSELKKLLTIHQASKNLAIHCSAGMGRTGVLELAYCLYADSERFYPNGVPDFKQIRMKLEELRVLRPALIQGSEQYRMAVIVGLQLKLVSRDDLVSEADLKKIEDDVDSAARQAMQTKCYLAPESSDDEDNNVVSEGSERSGGWSNRVSDDEILESPRPFSRRNSSGFG